MLSQLLIPLVSLDDAKQVWHWGWAWGPHTWWMAIIRTFVFTVVAVAIWISFTDWVPFGHQAMKIRRGNIRKYWYGRRKGQPIVVGPGFRFAIVKWDSLHKVDKREKTHELPPIVMDAEKGELGQMDVIFAIVYEVFNIVPSATQQQDVHNHMHTTSRATLDAFKRARTPLRDICDTAHREQQPIANAYGVHLKAILIANSNDTKATQWAKSQKAFGLPALAAPPELE
jgi:hypothetical protein